jgi:YVTN family beta-propeller protein
MFFRPSPTECILVDMTFRTFLALAFVGCVSPVHAQVTAQENPHVAPTTAAGIPGAPIQSGVEAILPNGRQIRPLGTWIPLAPFPFAIAMKPGGDEVAIPSIGFPFALNVVSNPASAAPTVQRLPGFDAVDNDANVEVHAGLAYAPDGKTLYVATGDSGKIAIYSTGDWHKTGEIPLDGEVNQKSFSGSFAASVLVSGDGRTLFALDQGNWRIVVIDVAERKLIASVPTGTTPYAIALAPDGRRLYVTNTGLFEYSTIPGARKGEELETGLHFPAFGYPSREARAGTVVEGRKVPGLGLENTDRGSSLWTYDIHDPSHPAVTARLRLGDVISSTGKGNIGGSAPTGVLAAEAAVYVSLAHQDAVVKLSVDGQRLLALAQLSPFVGPRFEDAQHRSLRGVMPNGLALSSAMQRLYVAESGIDAVAILDPATLQVLGHIPAGWNPSAVALSPDEKTLYIVNTKGKGAGPNGGKEHPANAPSYIGSLEFGSLGVVTLSALPEARSLTASVLANNTFAIANQPPLPRLKHTFLVIRENRTYDELLGDVAGANGDASLARYGLDGWAEERGKHEIEASHLKVTPNLHALAHQFAISDNFYVDSDVSADGHRWALGINPTPFFNTAWTSGYGGRRSSDAFAEQPGRRALFGGADAPMPEDEPQFGSLWEHVANSGLGILNYGEGLEIEGGDEIDGAAPEGQRVVLNSPVPKPVFEHTDRRFPTFNLGIPDQFRFEEFKRDLTQRIARHQVPGLIVIRLPGDHTADPRPADGYPYRASYVADNDLALGRIVDYLSRTSIWKDSALFVTEDDAQDGIDHVDAHRSILLLASPWVKPGSISHQHSSMGSITRTINELLGVGALNLEDALAGEFTGVFTTEPSLTPFASVPSDPRVFDPGRAKIAKPKSKAEAEALLDMDDSKDIQEHLEKTKDKLRRAGDQEDSKDRDEN